MGLFSRLFTKESEEIKTELNQIQPIEEDSEWQKIAGYIPVEREEYERISVIATAIAAGDQPDSSFTIKRIMKRNPEAELVSVIASSIASADQPESQFVVRSIQEKK